MNIPQAFYPRLILAAYSLGLSMTLAVAADSGTGAAMPEKHFAVLDKYCLECHDSLSDKGGVNLEDVSFEIDSVESAELWQKVLNVMNSGEMPPEDEKQLTTEEKTAFLKDLSDQMVVAREALSDTGGVITMRRLNRREYENSIYDLLGVRVNAEDLPDDANAGGFDTTGSALFFSSDQFEQYLKLGRQAIQKAVMIGNKPERKQFRLQPEVSMNQFIAKVATRQQEQKDQAEAWRATNGKKTPADFGFIDENDLKFHERVYQQQGLINLHYLKSPYIESGATLNLTFNGSLVPKINIDARAPRGEYLLRIRAARLPGASEEDSFLEYGLVSPSAQAGELELLGCRKITGTIEEPQILEIPISVGEEGLFQFGVRQRAQNNRESMRRKFLLTQIKTGLGPEPSLWVDWMELDGPLDQEWPPPRYTQLLPKGVKKIGDPDVYAREVIERFAKRAFRIKEPSPAYIDKLVEMYQADIAEGEIFRVAIQEPLAAILASSGFLYMIEPAPTESGQELTDLELAVRLSYFLWSAPPDEELMRAAEKGELKKSERLAMHTNRLLDDPRAHEFISSFAHQWLHMERLDFFQFNYRNFWEFDDSVKEAARHEVYETIHSVLKEKRPLADLLKADHVIVNDLLANYYGLEGVNGSEFQKVSLPAGSPRGGILGMAAVHAMGSDGERTSPVERGAWVLRSLLDNPPPPAPPNVPQLSRIEDKLQPARSILSAHMEEAQCAQCHQRIDPIGYGMENFDAAGKWREMEVAEKVGNRRVVASKEFPIDASGELPDGTKFTNYFELRDGVAENSANFERGFTEALIEYALGRPYGFSDEALRERILKRARGKNGEMREFVLALVQSKPFRTKK
ncbi:MAG: DUF1592 domain-containing protein [Verrucomicrobiales bacterium]|nr:DUF1592 domain-containing protein [Verrucomicrobiales bacterium]